MSGVLYKLYDEGDELLYVGATMNLSSRLGNHRSDKEWFSDVARVEVEHFDSREEAHEAEQKFLHGEDTPSPRFNTIRTEKILTEAEVERRRQGRERKDRIAVATRVRPEEMAGLKELAEREHRSISGMVAWIVRCYLVGRVEDIEQETKRKAAA